MNDDVATPVYTEADLDQAYQNGYEDGHSDGCSEGYSKGYEDGCSARDGE